LDQESFDLVLETYLLQYILDENSEFSTYDEMRTEVVDTYPGWGDFLTWAHDLHSGLEFVNAAKRNPFKVGKPFQDVAKTIEEIGHAYGVFQRQECNSLKDILATMEISGTARVPLGEFYKMGLGDTWKFWESPDYLRYLGALDEANPKAPLLIIPNFVAGHSNCVASSSFIEVCCALECDSLMESLERRLATPLAKPQTIAELVSGLPSESVDAPRNLSTALLGKLDDIASKHDGEVPIHGRLFSQWMHHAYPLECPYPSLDPNQQLTKEEFDAAHGDSILELMDQRALTSKYSREWRLVEEKGADLPWVEVEELVSAHWRQDANAGGSFRTVMFLLAAMSMVVPLLKVSKSVCIPGSVEAKHFV
jgi:hypothetical protein